MYVHKLLLLEDEEKLRTLIKKYLVKEGYQTSDARNGEEALQLIEEEVFDLLILDVMLPDIDGWIVCKEFRKKSSAPIIMLTARSSEEDKLFGFELGVDDYLTKPFSTPELLARIKALLKRSGKSTENSIIINKLIIEKDKHKVYINKEEIELTPKEYDLLLFFHDNSELALSRETILDRVWGYDYYGDLRTVDTHVKRLRKKLVGSGTSIETVRGVGYRFGGADE